MKKTAFILALVAFIISLISPLVVSQIKLNNTYPMTAVVVKVSRPNDTVTIRDFNGNLWQFKGAEDWEVNDIASCIMDNKSTDRISDDEVISVRYDGYLEGWAE